MKTLNVILSIFLALLFMRCGKTPTASFETDKAFYYAGETIHFKNTSSEGESYQWTFPDGTTSTEKDPSFVIPGNTTEEYIPIQLKAYSKKERKSNYLGKSVSLSLPLYNNEFYATPFETFRPFYKSIPSKNSYQYVLFLRSETKPDNITSELCVFFTGSRPQPGNYYPGAGVRFQLATNVNTNPIGTYQSANSGTIEITQLPDNKLLMKISKVILYENSYSGNSSSELNAEIVF